MVWDGACFMWRHKGVMIISDVIDGGCWYGDGGGNGAVEAVIWG